MRKKHIFFVAVFFMTVMLAGLWVGAQSPKAGGYSYLDADGNIDFESYFTVAGADIQMKEKSVDFVMQGETATITYNKELAAATFGVTFNGVEENTLKTVGVELTDAKTPSETVQFIISTMGGGTSLARVKNASRTLMIPGSFHLESEHGISVYYDADNRSFMDGTNYTLPIDESLDGSVFSGFSSNKVNLTIYLTGKPGSVFRLTAISQQRTGTEYVLEDQEGPNVVVLNPKMTLGFGSTVALPEAFAMDVLADNATVTMTVTDPEGHVVKATDGTKLENVTPTGKYKVKINKYGRYRVGYLATDGTNEVHSKFIQILVLDEIKPEISLAEDIAVSRKVGDKLVLPEATYTDNVSESKNIGNWITVKFPGGRYDMPEQGKITLTEEGVYEIIYSAVDEAGNITSLTRKIYAEGGE